MSFFIFLALY